MNFDDIDKSPCTGANNSRGKHDWGSLGIDKVQQCFYCGLFCGYRNPDVNTDGDWEAAKSITDLRRLLDIANVVEG
jgi:hypothetical protein